MDAALKNTLTNRKSIEHKYSRMYFRYEPIGTTLYLYSFGNDKFYLSKTRKKPNAASYDSATEDAGWNDLIFSRKDSL